MNFQRDIDACISTMAKGGIILYPTDTVWGLGCDATNESAVKKIFSLKQRTGEKSMIVLVASANDIENYAKAPSDEIKKTMAEMQKPLTIIYPFAKGFAKNVIAGDGSVAIRVAGDGFCRELIRAFGKPVVSTSANISAEATPLNFDEISSQVKTGADYVVQHRQNEKSFSSPSRILRWTEDEKLIVIRD